VSGLIEPWHGTAGGYNNYACRCDACTVAKRDQTRKWRQRIAGQTPEHAHGTIGGYTNYRCRCQPCTEAMAAYAAARYARKKADR